MSITEDIRMECLAKAITARAAATLDVTAKEIVEMAKEFEAYLTAPPKSRNVIERDAA